MTTASELLADLLVEGHDHPVVDRETRFVIDPHTRLISHANENELFVMQGDHNSERFTFELPRYIDGHDMTLCNRVRVHFNNIDESGETSHEDVAEITDLAVDPEDPSKVICSWLIKRQATQHAGILSFLVQFLCTTGTLSEDNFEVVYEWHTDIFNGVTVKSGRNNSEAAVSKYTNILEQWGDRLFGVRDSLAQDLERIYYKAGVQAEQIVGEVMANIEAKGQETLETIPDDYTETYHNARKALRTRANATVNTAEGNAISVNDASDDYLRGLRVFGKSTQVTTTGKNLVNLPQHISKPSSAYNYDLFAGTSGQSTAVPSEYLNNLPYLQPGTYYFHVIVPEEYKDAGTKVLAVTADGTIDNLLLNECGSFTLTAPTRVTIRIGSNAAFTVDDVQIESGSVYTGYEPYSGGLTSPSPDWAQPIESIENLTVDVHNKNLWNHEYDTVDLTSCFGWGNSIWNNDAVVRTLRPGTTYTMSFDVTALSIPEHETMFADNCGFTLFSSKASGEYIVMAQSIGEGVLKVGEKRSVKSTFTTPANLLDDGMGYGILRYTQRFIKSDGAADYATVKFENIQLELGGTATKYTDANMQSLTLTRTLPGIPVDSGGNYADENGQQWVCDEIDFERGVYVQRVKTVILDGSDDEAWMLYDNNAQQGLSFVYYPSTTGVTLYQSSLCDKYRNVNGCWGEPYYGQTGIYSDHTGVTGKYFRPPNTSVNSLETWKLWLAENPLTLVYILKTPIETPLSEAELYNFSQLHSNYPTTMVMNDQGAHMELKYNADTKSAIDSQIADYIPLVVRVLRDVRDDTGEDVYDLDQEQDLCFEDIVNAIRQDRSIILRVRNIAAHDRIPTMDYFMSMYDERSMFVTFTQSLPYGIHSISVNHDGSVDGYVKPYYIE